MSRGSHARFGFASLFRLCVVVLALSLAAARGAFAVDPLNVGFSAPSIDLLPYLAGLETDVRSVQIKRPDGRDYHGGHDAEGYAPQEGPATAKEGQS